MSIQHEEEIWKDIPEFEGLYQASNLGRIKSLDRYDSIGRFRPSTIRVLFEQNSGYLSLVLNKNGIKYPKTVHKMVYEAFNGVVNDSNLDVAHEDGNKYNCSISNLKLKTKSENSQDKRKHGTQNYQWKTHCDFGHVFEDWNLINFKKNIRKCLACSRARSWARSHEVKNVADLADLCYKHKMTVNNLIENGFYQDICHLKIRKAGSGKQRKVVYTV